MTCIILGNSSNIMYHNLILESSLSTLDTMWVLLCSVLVIFMTIPGLSLFYGGLVRKKNVISILMKSFAICAVISLVWITIGYSLAFSHGNSFIGDLSKFCLRGVKLVADFKGFISVNPDAPTIPESVFVLYSMSFAVIAPALITGGFAERMKFTSCLVFSILWSICVYSPIAHLVWDKNGWLNINGVLDFAGGTVVHITSGVAGLVSAIMLGKRDLGRSIASSILPYNLVFSFIGASILWIGWFGFNGGSTFAFNSKSILAVINTQLSASSAAMGWIALEAIKEKPSAIGAASGAIAGLVAVTPCAGFIYPYHAIFIGLTSGIFCYYSCGKIKRYFGYDDALDAFGIHGVGGIIGALFTGLFAVRELSGIESSVITQLKGVVIAVVYTSIITVILLKFVDRILGLRVDKRTEILGLDVVQHGSSIEE